MKHGILAIAAASAFALPVTVQAANEVGSRTGPDAIITMPDGTARRAGGVIKPQPPTTLPATLPATRPLTLEERRLLLEQRRLELEQRRIERQLAQEQRRENRQLTQEERRENRQRNTSLDAPKPADDDTQEDVGRGPLDRPSGAVISPPPGGQGDSRTGPPERGALERPSGGAISPPPGGEGGARTGGLGR